MRIKMTKCQAHPDGVFPVGVERDVDKEEGEALKAVHAAVEVETEEPAKIAKKSARSAVENAAKDLSGNA